MARTYSLRDFLRQAPNALLRRRLSDYGAFAGVDWDELGETDIAPLIEAFNALDDRDRLQIESEFRDINDLSDEAGSKAIREEAEFHGEDLAERFAEMDDFTDRAFWALLERKTYFTNALRFAMSDRLPQRQWQKQLGLPLRRPADAQDTLRQLEAGLSQYFRRQGRGKNCKVEVYKRGRRYYFFAFLEDFARADQDFEAGTLQRKPHRPAFEVVFAFDPTVGTLETYAPGGAKVVRELQDQFALMVLDQAVGDNPADDRVYDLEPLRDRRFQFTYTSETGIDEVTLRRLRLSYRNSKGKRIVLEGADRETVYDLYEEIVWDAVRGSGIPEALLWVTQAEVRVTYVPVGSRRPSAKLIRITYPNGCSLGADERDDALRKILVDSGIDPSGLGYDRGRR